jgi:hypothetical protein
VNKARCKEVVDALDTSRAVGGVAEEAWAWDDLSSLPTCTGEYAQTGSPTTAWLPDPTSTTRAALAQSTGGASSWLLSDPSANIANAVTTAGSIVSGTRSQVIRLRRARWVGGLPPDSSR